MSLPTQNNRTRGRASLKIWEMAAFSMLGSLMFVSKELMELLPNIHLLGMLIVVYTVVYRWKALVPIYIYVLLDGVFSGFSMWWLPYLYIWALLWAVVMLIPRRIPKALAFIVYPIICSLHGFLFGILYAPAQAILFGLNFEQMLAWIAAGAPFDIIHGISNLCTGFLILPISELLRKLSRGRVS